MIEDNVEIEDDRSDGVVLIPCPKCNETLTIGGLPVTFLLSYFSRCSRCGPEGVSPIGECTSCGIVVHADKDRKLYYHPGVTFRVGTVLSPWKAPLEKCDNCKEEHHDKCSGIADTIENGIRISKKCECDCSREDSYIDVVLPNEGQNDE